MIHSTNGIVLRVHQSRESDLVVHLLTPEHGKLQGLARAGRKSKKRFAGSIDVFDCGTFSFARSRGSLPTIDGFNATSRFNRLRDSLERLAAASCLAEALDLLTGDESSEGADELYRFYCSSLEQIQELKETREILRSTCQSLEEILAQSGFLPRSGIARPSAKELRRLITLVEHTAEREMKTKASIELIIRSLTREAEGN